MEKLQLCIVGGCGHVGLPLGIVFAQRGDADVTLLDLASEKTDSVNAGHMPFLEEGAEPILKEVAGRTLRATTDEKCVAAADVVITVIGTPVDKHLNPTVHDLYRTLGSSLRRMRPGALLVLRSTVYPGVTKLVFDQIRREGYNIDLAFCPERIAEGHAIEELTTLPQIVSAFEERAMGRARELFLRITPRTIELDPLEAELAKLFTNSWRYLNFAISNQFYMVARQYGLDFNNIHQAVTSEYPRMKSFARAGFAAGPCLLKDTLQLSAFANNNFFLGHAAMLINEGLPNFLVDELRRTHDLPQMCVSILGMTFKADCDDVRDSLSYKLRHLLEVHAREVLSADPYVVDASFVSLREAVDRADIIMLGVPHSEYRDLQFPPEKILVDVWGAWNQARKPLRTFAAAQRGT